VVADPERNHPQHPPAARPRSTRPCGREGSPLKVHVERQATLLRGRLGQAGHRVVVDYAMRYGQPSIPATLSRSRPPAARRILLLPLYPQYAASTTATAFDAVAAWLQSVRNQPEIRSIRSFADHPGYIAALAASVREHWASHGRPVASYRLVMSFHGLPRYTLDKGRPLPLRVPEDRPPARRSARSGPRSRHQICFQSRFGRTEWLQPYTAATLQALARQGRAAGRCDLSRVSGGLPRDARRNRHRRQERVPAAPAAGSTTTFRASTSGTTGSARWPTLPPATCRAGRRAKPRCRCPRTQRLARPRPGRQILRASSVEPAAPLGAGVGSERAGPRCGPTLRCRNCGV
jgi:hypothetical protein